MKTTQEDWDKAQQEHPLNRERIMERSTVTSNVYLNDTIEKMFKAADLEFADDLIRVLQASPHYQQRVATVKLAKVAQLEKQLAEAKKEAGLP